MSERALYHLAPRGPFEVWRGSERGAYAPPSLAAEGFVHLSFTEQLAGTLEAHFDPADTLLLVELDAARLGAELRVEPSRGGALFPHLYRALRVGDVRRAWPLRRADGRWVLPEIGPGTSGARPGDPGALRD